MILKHLVIFALVFGILETISGHAISKLQTEFEISDEPIDESDSKEGDQTVKGSINALKLNEKVEVDDKNPKLAELKKEIEKKLKEKDKQFKEEEKKKEKDKVVNLKPKKGEKPCGIDEKSKEDKKD